MIRLKSLLLEQNKKIYTKPGDRYQYKVEDGMWYTKGGKHIDWQSLKGNQPAMDVLNKRYPDAISKSSTDSEDTPPTKSLQYPYGELKQNPTPAFIAKIIEDSYGGIFGNDNEAHVEASVRAIKNAAIYNEVSHILGKDIEKFILKFMYPSELKKKWDGGPTIRSMIDNIKAPKVEPKNVGYGIALSWPTYQPTLDKSTLKTIDSTLGKVGIKASYNDIMKSILGADYKPGSVGKAGHGGVAIVKPDGTVVLAEFGRYGGANKDEGKKWFLTQTSGKEFAAVFKQENGRTPTYKDIPDEAIGTFGVVKKKNLGRIAKIANNKISNLDSVLATIKRNSQADGPNLPMEAVVLSNFDVTGGLQFINGYETRQYILFDTKTGGGLNCATFVVDAMIAGKIRASGKCFPTIHSNIKYLRNSPNVIQTGSA